MTDPSPAESAPDRPSGAPWLLASIGTAAIVMGFSWFGGFVSWHDAVAPPFDDSPALTLSTFKPHGAKAAHAAWVLSDRALCIGPYSAAAWTALRAASLGVAILCGLVAFRSVLTRMAGCSTDRAAAITALEARRMLAWWILPLVGLFGAGALLAPDAMQSAGLLWVGFMSVAWLPLRMATCTRSQGMGGVIGPTLVQALVGIACLVGAVLAAGALVAPPA